MNIKYKMVYNSTCYDLVDHIVDTYKIDIDCYNEEHYKEKKDAVSIKVDAGTKLVPFIGAYNIDDEGKETLIGAMWGESDTKINEQSVKEFIKYIEYELSGNM